MYPDATLTRVVSRNVVHVTSARFGSCTCTYARLVDRGTPDALLHAARSSEVVAGEQSPQGGANVKAAWAIVVAVLLLSACAMTYEAKLRSWIGDSADHLMRSWGAPTRIVQMPNGHTILVYERGSTFTTPRITMTPSQTTGYVVGNTFYATTTPAWVLGGNTITSWCRTEFEATPSGRLVRWRWEGNAC